MTAVDFKRRKAWAICGPKNRGVHLDKIMASQAEAWGLLADAVRDEYPDYYTAGVDITRDLLKRQGYSCCQVEIVWAQPMQRAS